MAFFSEFKTFISRGNVVDMAVGVVVGGAFKSIIDSLVADIITPVISVATGKVNIADLSVKVSDELTIPYGSFLQSVLNFLIISFTIFCAVKSINAFREKIDGGKEEEEEKEPEMSNEEKLLTQIRDILKNE